MGISSCHTRGSTGFRIYVNVLGLLIVNEGVPEITKTADVWIKSALDVEVFDLSVVTAVVNTAIECT